MLALRPEVNQPTMAILSMTLLGLSLGLLFFNWYPAKILSGTGGAYFFGFALATLALYAGTKVATLLIVLAIPVFDALFVLVRRLVEGHSPFLPDEAHLHHLLLARGWHPALIASTYLLVTALLGLLALALQDGSKVLAFAATGLLLAAATAALHWSLRDLPKMKHPL
jgi:UDP-GlcNAc:undecaprenyl-phosphate GlcNAc-1-phosphate transferase